MDTNSHTCLLGGGNGDHGLKQFPALLPAEELGVGRGNLVKALDALATGGFQIGVLSRNRLVQSAAKGSEPSSQE